MDGESQACVSADARRQFAVCVQTQVPGHRDSNHTRPVYPNLARELVLTGVNQLWIADLTYIWIAGWTTS
jgi:hypothetical protein